MPRAGGASITRAAMAAALLALALAAAVGAPASSHSAGITGQTRNGCTCHNATESTAVTPAIGGLPAEYEPGRVYALTIAVDGGAPLEASAKAEGGFDLNASAGTLKVPKGIATVRVDPSTGEATHTLEGRAQRNWTIEWRAPGEGEGTVTFTLLVNTVNGDGVQGPPDQWGRAVLTSEPAGAGTLLDVPLFWKVLGAALVVGVVVAAWAAVRGPRITHAR